MRPDFARTTFWALLLTGISLPSAQALAGNVTVPYSATFTTRGTIAIGSTDNLGLFGGGDLVGLPFVNTLTVVFPGLPWNVLIGRYYTGFGGAATDTFTVNDHSYSFQGGGGVQNYSFPTTDRRSGVIEKNYVGPYETIRVLSAVDRSPPQWAANPSGANIFSENTVISSGSTPGLFGIFVIGQGWATDLMLNDTSIASTFTTTVISVPEPNTWEMALAGFAILGCMGYRRRLTVRAGISPADCRSGGDTSNKPR